MVGNALEHLLAAPRPVIPAGEVRRVLDTWQDIQWQWRERAPLEVRLKDCDALLDGGPEEQPCPQEVAA
jgi:hypothetical protein